MKKKLMIAFVTTALVLGIGTAALANTDAEIFEGFNFNDMLPFMQQMHPDLEEEQLEEMFNFCHGEDGVMRGQRGFMNGQGYGPQRGFMNGEGYGPQRGFMNSEFAPQKELGL